MPSPASLSSASGPECKHWTLFSWATLANDMSLPQCDQMSSVVPELAHRATAPLDRSHVGSRLALLLALTAAAMGSGLSASVIAEDPRHRLVVCVFFA